MKFNSKTNKITVRGHLITHVLDEPNCDYAVTFKVKVARPHEPGKKEYYDEFDIYASDKQQVCLCKANLARGMSVCVKGEMRQWVDNRWRLCASDIQPIW